MKEEMKTTLRLRKVGNSLGIIIPSSIVNHFEANENDLIEIDILNVYKKEEKTSLNKKNSKKK